MRLKKIAKLLLLSLFAVLFSSAGDFYANAAIGNQMNNLPPIPNPSFDFLNDNGQNPQNFHYSNGLLQLDVEWSDLFGFVFDSKVIPKLNENNALAIETDVGEKEGRINITWGTRFGLHNLAKLTAERLSQNLSFNFASGPIAERIPQYAFGGQYEYALSNTSRFNDINLGGYYADASSKSLDSVEFTQAGGDFIDFRHIAGSTSKGLNLGVDVKPWLTSAFGVKLNYDQVDYNPIYTLKGTNQNNGNFGATLKFEQLLTNSIKFDASGSKREIYDEYDVSTSWLLPIFPCNHVEAEASIDHTISHTDTPNNTSYLLGVNFALEGDPNHCFNDYSFPSFANNDDIVNWTGTPAVHMAYVLAAADEKIQKVVLAVFSITPTSGPASGGTSVTITGAGFVAGVTVSFGGTAATNVVVVNSSTITAVTPTHAGGTVSVTITNPDGSSVTLTSAFLFTNAATVTKVTPSSGSTGGTTAVTITGANFTGATSVTFGGSPITNLVVVNDNTITGNAPAHTAGTVNVIVTIPGGTGTLINGYTFNTPAPTNVNPASGSTAGGTSVTITGTFLEGSTGVTFGGVAATNVVAASNGLSLTCTTPAHAAGIVNVVVSNSIDSGTLANGYTYAAPPNPLHISPSSGSTAGNQTVTITGSGLINTTDVTFNGVPATFVTVVNDGTVTAVTPSNVHGTVPVNVTGTGGTAAVPGGYIYTAPAPTSLLPNNGTVAGNTPVTISGSGFTGATQVVFGDQLATNMMVASDTSITCKTPASDVGATAVDVIVINAGDSGTLHNGFTYN